MTSAINRALMHVPKRADSVDSAALMRTFVDVGPLVTLLEAPDHQVIYGRRGTGKTHALRYLADSILAEGGFAVAVDLRQIGSSGGLYADSSLAVTERATHLLIDALGAVHSELTDLVLDRAEDDAVDFTRAMKALDQIADEITRVRVRGSVETSSTATETAGRASTTGVSVGSDGVRGALSDTANTSSESVRGVRRTGTEEAVVQFGGLGQALSMFVDSLPGTRTVIMLDEWSAVPVDLQPLLADLLRRCVFPVRGLTVKIAAIEHRSRFLTRRDTTDYLGIELGADATASTDLDDFLVFRNDSETAQEFFRELLYRHCTSAMASGGIDSTEIPVSAAEFVRIGFTSADTFAELVRAAEGVPRDAINVAALAAQHAVDDRIGVQHVRTAARTWYQRDKETNVVTDPEVEALLFWIVDEVIGTRRTKGFLLAPTGIQDPRIQTLYDGRVLHVLRKGISSRDQPGVRFNAYGLDYGCYVHLTTARAPLRLFDAAIDGSPESHQEVPSDDYRSIRTALLDLEDFQAAHPS